MIRALAVDTSSWWASVALLQAPDAAAPACIAEIGVEVRDSHSHRLLGWVESLLAEAGWGRSSIDLYVAIRGPGSFTGIRIGLGTLRGFALATGRPCFGISTLDALAEAFGPAEGRRVALVAAGRGEVYGATYPAAGSPPVALEPPWVGEPSRALAAAQPGPAVLFGSGAAALAAAHLALPPGTRIGATPRALATAAGRLALGRFGSGDEAGIAPLYVRPPDAWTKLRSG